MSRKLSLTPQTSEPNHLGFTIVELLIVIVVIGILAAISIVAYNGIQTRAHNTTIRNDLANFAKKLALHKAETGEYPVGGGTKPSAALSPTGNSGSFPGFEFSPTKDSYSTGEASLHYCRGTVDGSLEFRVAARSKSGQSYEYTSLGGLKDLGSLSLWDYSSHYKSCEGFGYPWTYSTGNNHIPVWADWTN